MRKVKQNDVSHLLFQDAIDPTRFLRVVQENDKTLTCKVFFDNRKNQNIRFNASRHLIYYGQVELSKRIFSFENKTRTGINLVT